jgi:hypothetical protein
MIHWLLRLVLGSLSTSFYMIGSVSFAGSLASGAFFVALNGTVRFRTQLPGLLLLMGSTPEGASQWGVRLRV